MPKQSTYTNCRCPHCRNPLDDVATTAATCPLCNQPLDPDAVWLTRRYPGTVNLPWWVRILTWPLLLMLLGGTVFVLKWGAGWDIPTRGWWMFAAELSFALGAVRAIFIWAMKGDD